MRFDMSMPPFVLRSIALPTWQRLTGQSSLAALNNLEESQWLSIEEQTEQQWQQIGTLLDHAWKNVPYYRKLLKDLGVTPAEISSSRNLVKLPLLDRKIVNTKYEQLIAHSVPNKFVRFNSTGGSTGEPLRFLDDLRGVGISQAAGWRAERWYGVNIGERRAYLWGANFDLTRYQGFNGKVRVWLHNLLMLPAWRLNEDSATSFFNEVHSFRPRMLLGYAGSVFQWAKLLRFERHSIPTLKAIIVSGETLYDNWREGIEQTFGVPVYNRYGGRDLNFLAQECPEYRNLHVAAENAYIEIVRENRPAEPGETGEIVLTKLNNYVMPFIRYRTGDLGVMSATSCPCGRGLPVLDRIEGRVQDVIVTADGRVVSGLLFAHLMKDCPEVREFQVHQIALNHLTFLLVTEPQGALPSQSRIERVVHDYMGSDMHINYEFRDEIPLTRSGKRRICISHLDEVL